MRQPKKKQHYVWYNYLCFWVDAELIWTRLKKQGITKQITLRDADHFTIPTPEELSGVNAKGFLLEAF